MNKKTLPLLLATAAVLGACSTNDDGYYNPDEGKTAIELGAVDNAMTRAGFTGAETKLMIHYVSTRKAKDESTFPYDDGKNGETAKGTLYMASSASAAKDETGNTDSYSTVTQTTAASGNTMRYWDDAHGKNSLISLYAIAVPNKTSLTNTTNKVYFDGTSSNVWSTAVKEGTETTMSHDLPWVVSATQTSATIDDEDITYSNNVSGDGKTIGFSTSTNKFEKAEGTKSLVFNHALSRFTINVKKGEGFGDFSSEFKITTAKLSKQTTGGTLNASTGAWTSSATEKDVDITGTSTDFKDGESKLGYTFNAQVLPNVTLKEVTATMLTFTVDGNNYYISGNDIYKALIDNNSGKEDICAKLNAGYNYKLTVTIKKSAIEITSAKLVDWNEITGTEQTPSNAIALTASMEKTAGTQTTIASDIYRSTTLATGYTDKNTLSAENALGSAWYWPNNSTSYFFRTISPQNTAVTTATNDNITMTGGAIADCNDYIWGAPLEEKHTDSNPHTFTYSTTDGYNSYLYPAIGATKSEIHITQFHMMSNIEVKLTTSDDDSKIDLSSATVTMKGHKTSGTLNLSNALITPTGDASSGDALTVKEKRSEGSANFTWRTIPQGLTDVTFEISAGGNNYTVKLTDILKSGSTTDAITSWLPGEAYTYQFKITKTGIVISSAKLVDWATVTGTIKDITLEN